MSSILEKLESRATGIQESLTEEDHKSLDTQAYLVEGTPERAHWHSGYMVALNDVIRLIKKEHAHLN